MYQVKREKGCNQQGDGYANHCLPDATALQ